MPSRVIGHLMTATAEGAQLDYLTALRGMKQVITERNIFCKTLLVS